MDATRWERIQHVFEEASELPEPEREPWLAAACGADEELYGHVRSLLLAYEEERGELEQVVGAYAQNVTTPPSHVGPYRILSEIGHGGMGSVYLAEPIEPHRPSKVAVKMLRVDARSDPDLARRFRTEWQILGELEHPNIARMLDGGITEDGIQYLAMEYVNGLRIDEYCRQNHQSLRERLALFRKVCAAVQEAHRRLVVHRDIKPSNILVTQPGEPKLVDFGIAKLLRSTDYSIAQTRPAERLMTPAYASPEQIRGETITTATDVYSLGIVLYELLAGRRPFEARDSAFLERAICEAEPQPPSAAAVEAGAAFVQDLRGDLDHIILKAIRKEPRARYLSVEQFSEDLERYLGRYPVIARRGTRRYLVEKFIRRHHTAVIASAASLLLLIGSTFLVSLENARVRKERDIARRERLTAQKVSSFLVGLFEASDPYQNRGAEISARQVLDSGASRISKELRAEPQVRAELLETIGQAYRHLNALDGAEQMFREKVEVVSEFYGPESEDAVQVLRQLGDTERLRGHLPEAEADLRRALAISAKLPPGRDLQQSHALNNLALVELTNGDLVEAEDHARRAIAINSKYPREASQTLTMKSNLGLILEDRGKNAEAEALLRDVWDQRRKVLGDNHPQVPYAILYLGSALDNQGRFYEAEQLDREAWAQYQKLNGPQHADTLQAACLLAVVLTEEGRLAEAEALDNEIIEKAVGDKTDNVRYFSTWWGRFAWTLFNQGKFAEAEKAYQQSLAAFRTYGAGSIREARAVMRLGQVYAALGRDSDARRRVESALDVFRSKSGTSPGDIAEATLQLALISPRGPETEGLLRQAMEMDRSAEHLLGLADFLVETGRTPEAENLAREAIERRVHEQSPDFWSVDLARTVMARIVARQGQPVAARSMAEAAVSSLTRKLGPMALATQVARDRALLIREGHAPQGAGRLHRLLY